MAKTNTDTVEEKKTCFIAMPISTPEHTVSMYGGDTSHFQHVMDHLIIPAVRQAGLEPIPPAATGADIIHAEIIKQLQKADLVLVDMSTLNPNVFFELGIRVAQDKPICLIKDEKTTKVPFDTTIINHHVYKSALLSYTQKNDVDELARHISASIEEKPDRLSLWKLFSLSFHAKSPEQGQASPDQMLELLNSRIENLIRIVTNSTSARQRVRNMHAPIPYDEYDQADDFVKLLMERKIGDDYIWDGKGVNVVFFSKPTNEVLDQLASLSAVNNIKTKHIVIDKPFGHFLKPNA